MRFEVHSGHRGGEKWYVKANHPVEASRWVTAIEASIAWGKAREAEAESAVEGSGASIMSSSASVGGGGGSLSGRQRLVSVLRKGTSMRRTGTAGSEAESMVSLDRESGEGSPRLGGGSDADAEEQDEDEDEDEGYDDSSPDPSMRTKLDVPHEATFELLGNTTAAQMELTLELLGSAGAAQDALKDALGMVNEYVTISRERDAWWRRRLLRAKTKQTAWEKSLASAVREGEELERELRMRSRKRGSRFFDADLANSMASIGANGTLKARGKRATLTSSSVLEEPSADSPEQETARALPEEPTRPALATLSVATDTPGPAPGLAPVSSAVRSETADTLMPSTATAASFSGRPYSHGDAESLIDTDEEDEFFDAIESNNIPNLIVNESLTSPTHSEISLPINIEPYAGYQQLREELALSDARPSTSLWSVLKHSIGKDLTKISFPVFFNEPTSMLQRMVSRDFLYPLSY
jgi:hypothetical protein